MVVCVAYAYNLAMFLLFCIMILANEIQFSDRYTDTSQIKVRNLSTFLIALFARLLS